MKKVLVLMMMVLGGTWAQAVTEVVEPPARYEITNILVSTGPAGYATKIVSRADQKSYLTSQGAYIAQIAITNEDPVYNLFVGTMSTVTANPVTSPIGQGRDVILPFQTLIINTNQDLWAIGPVAVTTQRHSTITVTTEYLKAIQ